VSAWREYITQHPEQFPYAKAAPRATLVKLPEYAPRAQLLRLPEWKVGETRPVLMPYNLQALATFRGQMPSIDMLPANGNQLGDMWVVAELPGCGYWRLEPQCLAGSNRANCYCEDEGGGIWPGGPRL